MPMELGVFDKGDGYVIADIHLSTMLPFMRYQFGDTSPNVNRWFLANQYFDKLQEVKKGKWSGNITEAKVVYRDGDKETPIAWAEWEEYVYAPKKYSSEGAPPTWNHGFLAAVDASAQRMYKKFLDGKKNYMLCQLFTVPEYKRRGAADMLLADTFAKADAEDAICFLEVDGDSKEMEWYKKKGFREPPDKEARCEIRWQLGEESGVYKHVAMIRQPGGVDSEG